MDTRETRPLIEMTGIVKRFPGVVALDRVDFALLPGEVHVLLGENGAGKSTLIKVLSGAYSCDEGEIWIDGEHVRIASPQVPLAMGLRFIYQEINLVQELDIARNMFLRIEPLKPGPFRVVDRERLYRRATECLERLHIHLSPRAVVGDLSVTQQKMVEIARALVNEAKALVLDEPTDVLEDRSRRELFDVIEGLKADGVGFIYISHRYAEVYEIGDRVTILRDGRNAGVHRIEDLTLDSMIEEMVGGQVKKQYPALAAPSEDIALRVRGLVQGTTLKGIDIELKQGEILGVTGLMGAGKTELGRAIVGCDPFDGGVIEVGGAPARIGSVRDAVGCGIAYLTEDRKRKGLVLEHSLRDNYAHPSIKRLSPVGLVQHNRINDEVKTYMDALQVKAPSMFTAAQALSGGNQQKVVLAKWLGAQCKVLIFDEPTRGIDIGGRAEVYRIMQDLLEQGVGILMLTSDYTEALEMSHRIFVLAEGRVVKEFNRGEATEESIFRAAIHAEQTEESHS